MSNETDLDWLARNEHYWPEDAVYVSRHENAVEWHYVELAFKGLGHFTKDQWLARRAELQNKPSWEDAPEWAEWLAQHASGYWAWGCGNPAADAKAWEGVGEDWEVQWSGCAGEVLGDWRDTLERRPETGATASNRQVQLNSSWFERGELPPIGVVCEAYIDYPPQWVEAEIVAHKDGFAIGWCKSVMKGCHGDKASEFRPIRTERELAIDQMCRDVGFDGLLSSMAAAKLYDEGCRKESK